MAIYTQLSNGSTGSDVSKMQQALADKGYSINVDGVYGPNTEKTVRTYQQNNGLSVDGVAGDKTLGHLYGTSAATSTSPTTGTGSAGNAASTGPDYSKYRYDPTSDTAYQEALAALQKARETTPTYAGTYDGQLQDIYSQIVNRDRFTFDLNADALYQQYKDQYVNLGRQAMMDTMGQAATLTGGYGNSYASTAGNQAYQAYLQKLTDIVPDLYSAAYDRYNQEGDDLKDIYSLTGDLSDTEYSRYQDALSNYYNKLSLIKDDADTAYDRGYNNWYNAYQMGVTADNTAYERQQDAYDNLVSIITATGYTPTATELAAAGMSQEQANAYAKYYAQQQAASSSSGSSGGSSGRSYSSGGGSGSGNDSGSNGGTGNSAVISAAHDYYNAHPSIALDSRTLDNYLNNTGYTTAEKTLFKATLQSLGATTLQNPTATSTTSTSKSAGQSLYNSVLAEARNLYSNKTTNSTLRASKVKQYLTSKVKDSSITTLQKTKILNSLGIK